MTSRIRARHVSFTPLAGVAARLRRACVVVGAAALLAMSAAAQQADAAADLDLPQAITSALSDNPGLRAVGYQLRAQEARILQTSVKPAPELLMMVENVLGSGENDVLRGAQTTLSVAWILERGVRARRIDAESASLDLMTVDMEVSRLDVAAETARRYLECLSLQTQIINALAATLQSEQTVVAVRARVDAGAVPAAELARAEADLARRRLGQEDLEHELLSATYRLAAQWGETTPNFAGVSGNVLALPEIADFAVLREQLEQNPDIARYLSQQRLYEAQLRLAEASRKAPLRVAAGVRQIETTGDHAFVVDMNLPLYRANSNRGRIEEARANLARTEAEAEAERIQMETALFVMYQQLQHSLMQAAVFRDEVIPLYENALAETLGAYEQGRYSYLELSSVQAELLAARDELVMASINAHQRMIEIERFTGVSIEASGL